MDNFYCQFYLEGSKYSLVIDDNGVVCYAYLLKEDKIISDVWLYNCGIAPESIDWRNKKLMPFQNPRQYTANNLIIPIKNADEISIDWEIENNILNTVKIYLRNSLFAILKSGWKPGMSKLALQDGPLARKIDPNEIAIL